MTNTAIPSVHASPDVQSASPTPLPLFHSDPPVVVTGPTSVITVLAWSPSSHLLAGAAGDIAGGDSDVYVWRADGSLVATLRDATLAVSALDWSTDGAILAGGSSDGSVRLWSASGSLLHTIDLSPEPVMNVAWDPTGELLAVASVGSGETIPGTVRLYTSQGTLVSTLSPSRRTGGKFFNLAWSPDGSFLVGGAVNYAIWARDGSLIASIDLSGTPAWGMALSTDGSIIALSDENGELFLYDAQGHDLGSNVDQYQAGNMQSLAFSGSRHLLAVGSRHVELIEAEADAQARTVQDGVLPQSNVAWSPDGEWLTAGSADQTVRVWRDDGSKAGELSGCEGVAHSVAWSPDGQWIAAGTDQQTVCIWHWQP